MRKSIRTIHQTLDLGINFFNTANMYGIGPTVVHIKKNVLLSWGDRRTDGEVYLKKSFKNDKRPL